MENQIERIKENIMSDTSLVKDINNVPYYSVDTFMSDAEAYVKAVKENRMINVIGSVAKSGMSRTIKFTSCERYVSNDNEYYQRNYSCLFRALGYKESKNSYGYFTISGCGMDMIFHTNYSIMHSFCRYGFITKEECDKLAQRTPSTI
jgi:hypothetical protein